MAAGFDKWSRRFWKGPCRVNTACAPKPRTAIIANRPFLTSLICKSLRLFSDLPKPKKLNAGPPATGGKVSIGHKLIAMTLS